MTERPRLRLHPPCSRCGATLSRGSVHVCNWPHIESDGEPKATRGGLVLLGVLWIALAAILYWIA
jgi:hypothetical protein